MDLKKLLNPSAGKLKKIVHRGLFTQERIMKKDISEVPGRKSHSS